MSGHMFMVASCCSCRAVVFCNPERVPSLVIEGVREPLCRSCFDLWNDIHRTSKGLEPVALDPAAYDAEPT